MTRDWGSLARTATELEKLVMITLASLEPRDADNTNESADYDAFWEHLEYALGQLGDARATAQAVMKKGEPKWQ